MLRCWGNMLLLVYLHSLIVGGSSTNSTVAPPSTNSTNTPATSRAPFPTATVGGTGKTQPTTNSGISSLSTSIAGSSPARPTGDGTDDGDWSLLKIIVSSAGGGSLLVIIIVCIMGCCWCKKRDEGDYEQPYLDKMASRQMKSLPRGTDESSSEYYSYATHIPSLFERLGRRLGYGSKKKSREGNIPLPPIPQGDHVEDYYVDDKAIPAVRSHATENNRFGVASAEYLPVEEGTKMSTEADEMYVNASQSNGDATVGVALPSVIYESVKERAMKDRAMKDQEVPVIADMAVDDEPTTPSTPKYYNVQPTLHHRQAVSTTRDTSQMRTVGEDNIEAYSAPSYSNIEVTVSASPPSTHGGGVPNDDLYEEVEFSGEN